MRLTKLSLLYLFAAVAVAFQGCGGCHDRTPEAPPKPVQGNARKAPVRKEPAEVPPPKDACAVLIFTDIDDGTAPLSTQLTAEGDCTQGTAKIEWDFGDGSPKATGENIIHTFEKPGTYMVKAKITSDEMPGVEDSDDLEIVVNAPGDQ